MIGIKRFFKVVSRKKPLLASEESRLAKVLSAFDLTALGVGSTLGVGVYVLAGEVSKMYSGPGIVLSLLIAALASVFAGLCYAEFGARVPKAGSAYVYSYVTIGEFIAFIIGWNLILEYAIGSAAVVKGLSTYLDALVGKKMSSFITEHMAMNVDGLEDYPDFFAFGVTMLFAVAIAIGAKESVIVNNIFTFLNLGVLLFVIIAGSFKADPSNWSIPASEVPEKYGSGGFFPYGFTGVIRGAAVCFYGFIGFDCIATAGEEAKNPKKSIPIAVCVSLLLIFLAYFGISTVLTMMLPYFEQDETAPLPYVFEFYGMTVSKYIVSIGALFGLCASLMGSMFPLPRIVFAMADDGLLFEFMGRIHPRFKTPFIGTLLTGLITGVFAGIFKLGQLINMLSIGTLLAYSMVAASILILRYRYFENVGDPSKGKTVTVWNQLINKEAFQSPSPLSSKVAIVCIICYIISCFPFALSLRNLMIKEDPFIAGDYVFVSISVIFPVLFVVMLSLQPTDRSFDSFKVPFVPFLPAFSILVNIYLMLELDIWTWIRLVAWIAIGLVIYGFYGAWNSKLRKPQTATPK